MCNKDSLNILSHIKRVATQGPESTTSIWPPAKILAIAV